MNKKYLDDHWDTVEKKVLNSIWHKHHKKYKDVGLEYGDFVNISYIILEREIHKYNDQKANFYTFAQMVVNKKMYSYISAISERDKTRASIYHESLNAPISQDTNTSLADIIPSYHMEDNTDCNKIRQYLSILSRIQKDVLIYHLLGFNREDIINEGGISEKQYVFAVGSMKMPEKLRMFNLRGKLK